jgi:hypothetical protein
MKLQTAPAVEVWVYFAACALALLGLTSSNLPLFGLPMTMKQRRPIMIPAIPE